MPKKKKSKSAKGKKKKGGSAKAKKSKGLEEPAAPPPLEFPWTAACSAWMGRGQRARDMMRESFRRHYLDGQGIVCTREEWRATLPSYATPYESPDIEAMVHMLVTCIARESSRKLPADTFPLFAAALRCRHSKAHFERMLALFATMLGRLDKAPSPRKLLELFTANNLEADGHISRSTLMDLLKTLNWVVRRPKPAGAVEEAPPAEGQQANPFVVFQDYVVNNRLRLLDLFRSVDKDVSGSLSIAEFRGMLATLTDLPINEEQLQLLCESLDLDNDGEIDYQEFAIGRADFIKGSREGQSLEDAAAEGQDVKNGNILLFDIDQFSDLVVHCHFVTRP